MAGLITIEIAIAGATQYVSTSPAVTFAEVININDRPPNEVAKIVGYSYTVLGTANDFRLVLTPPGTATGGAGDIILENRLTSASEAVNDLKETCDAGGFVVPRRYGLEASAQPPALPGDAVVSNETYQVFVSTALKDNDGTFRLWYVIEELDA